MRAAPGPPRRHGPNCLSQRGAWHRCCHSHPSGSGGHRRHPRRVGLSDLTSVKAGAAALNAAHTELHGLIFNALLLPLLTATPGARVVSVLSDAQRHGADLSLVDWTMEQGYSPTAADVRSKVANILFARELARRLAAAGSPVLDVAAQPGWCTTSLLVKATPELSTSIFIAVLKPFLSRSAEAGACCLLHAATEAPRLVKVALLDLKATIALHKLDDSTTNLVWAREAVTGSTWKRQIGSASCSPAGRPAARLPSAGPFFPCATTCPPSPLPHSTLHTEWPSPRVRQDSAGEAALYSHAAPWHRLTSVPDVVTVRSQFSVGRLTGAGVTHPLRTRL